MFSLRPSCSCLTAPLPIQVKLFLPPVEQVPSLCLLFPPEEPSLLSAKLTSPLSSETKSNLCSFTQLSPGLPNPWRLDLPCWPTVRVCVPGIVPRYLSPPTLPSPIPTYWYFLVRSAGFSRKRPCLLPCYTFLLRGLNNPLAKRTVFSKPLAE